MTPKTARFKQAPQAVMVESNTGLLSTGAANHGRLVIVESGGARLVSDRQGGGLEAPLHGSKKC